jgi:hypothetical protein
MIKKKYLIFLAAVTLLVGALACNFPGLEQVATAPEIPEPIEENLPTSTEAGAMEPPAQTVQPRTPTITPTFTPNIPMVRVTRNTNCRTGWGTDYDLVHILTVGEEAEIVARSSNPDYVVIEVPGSPGRECWLWMEYAQVTGSTEGLPEATPPPTRTPEPTATPYLNFTASVTWHSVCGSDESVMVRITNTGASNIESYQISATNQDTSETVTNQSNSFGQTPDCITVSVPVIPPGSSAYITVDFSAPIAGARIAGSLQACTNDGLGGLCHTRPITSSLHIPSDENAKENFEPVDNRTILGLVSDLPITSWNYRDSYGEGRHIGPMAQDFNPRFGVGEYEQYINAVDAYGVSLAAIQALSDIADDQDQRIALLEEQNQSLRAQNNALEERLESLESQKPTRLWIVWALALSFTGGSLMFWSSLRSGKKREPPA